MKREEKIREDLQLPYRELVGHISTVFTQGQTYIVYPISAMPSHQLSWSHYVELLKIDDDLERSFYEQQTQIEKNACSISGALRIYGGGVRFYYQLRHQVPHGKGIERGRS